MNRRPLLIALVSTVVALMGMLAYGLYLKHQAEQIQANVSDSKPVPAPAAGPAKEIVFYVPDDDSVMLRKFTLTTPVPPEVPLKAKEILRAFVAACQHKDSTHVMAEGADVKDVYIFNGNTAVVDTSAAFADQHRSGILVEQLTLAAMARTLEANLPEIKRMKLLVEGKERKTLAGHADLTQFYEFSLPDFAFAR